jgi:toxin ParE1/3/4
VSEYQLSQRADRELFTIFLDSIDMFGLFQARRYRDELTHCFELLAENPNMGRQDEALGEAVRRHEHKSHIILYEQNAAGVAILAIVHSRSSRRLKL